MAPLYFCTFLAACSSARSLRREYTAGTKKSVPYSPYRSADYCCGAGHKQTVQTARHKPEHEHYKRRRGNYYVYQRNERETFAQGSVYLLERGHCLVAVLPEIFAHLIEQHGTADHSEKHNQHGERHHREGNLHARDCKHRIEYEQVMEVCDERSNRHREFIPYYKIEELKAIAAASAMPAYIISSVPPNSALYSVNDADASEYSPCTED